MAKKANLPPISGAALLGAVQRRQLSSDDGTTPLGLLHFARAYAEAGKHLTESRLAENHRDAPAQFLLMHAVELYMKAYLRLRGVSVKGIVDLGHKFAKIARKAEKHGLHFDDEDRYVIEIMEHTRAWSHSRYIETGFFIKATPEALIRTCLCFDQSISEAMVQAGQSVRPLSWAQSAPQRVPDPGER